MIDYCAAVAASPDPDDPEAVERKAEQLKREKFIPNPRLDPYTGLEPPKETRTELLKRSVETEDSIERIIRARSWDITESRCPCLEEDWRDAFQLWKKRKGYSK